ncbi:MAG TPA: SDR family NAD(P)-dependent oxidoreductase [Devosia sp.]|nr:SDR family NAD(P)-dependent oxidoreductase [Devosia sp.]
MSLQGKVALVTGAAGSIGAAVSRRLAEDGAHVVLIDRAADALQSAAAPLGDKATTSVLDLADPDAIMTTVADLAHRFGHLDVLVNNAGILSNNKIAAAGYDEWRRIMAVNLDAAFLMTKAVLPSMRANRWGRIIMMSSFSSKSGGITSGTAYSTSKAALIGLTFTVARETTAQGITVNAIAPAYVMSPMVSEQLSAEQRAALIAQIPVGRFCEPEEIAHVVSFLASPLSGFITGEVIDVNGGLQFD